MYICTACGSNIPEGRRFCPACGAMLDPNAQRAPETSYTDPYAGAYPGGYGHPVYQTAPPAPSATTPTYVYQNLDKLRERVMSTGEYFSSLLLMFLPVIGLIIQIIWACGGARNKNRIHLARGYLLFTLIMYILIAVGVYYVVVTYGSLLGITA